MSIEKELFEELKEKIESLKNDSMQIYKWMHSQPIFISENKPYIKEIYLWINTFEDKIKKEIRLVDYKLEKKKGE